MRRSVCSLNYLPYHRPANRSLMTWRDPIRTKLLLSSLAAVAALAAVVPARSVFSRFTCCHSLIVSLTIQVSMGRSRAIHFLEAHSFCRKEHFGVDVRQFLRRNSDRCIYSHTPSDVFDLSPQSATVALQIGSSGFDRSTSALTASPLSPARLFTGAISWHPQMQAPTSSCN